MAMSTIDSIIEQVKRYNPDGDLDLIWRAHEFADQSHADQLRDSGEQYIVHPMATAQTLADLEMDAASISAAFLHDVVEDSGVTVDILRAKFGSEVALLVDGVTKLGHTDFDVGVETDIPDGKASDGQPKKRRVDFKRSAENLRKIFVAMASDFRVMVIKLADRLHNMETLDSLSEERRVKIARETMQIYAPLAHRLGIWTLKWQLEDLAFRYSEPEAYLQLVVKVAKTRAEREEYLQDAVEILKSHLGKEGIDAHIHARPKHLWSIYQKMIYEGVEYSDIYDLSALRVVVNTVGDCYHALGLVHDLWMPIPERFSDYIAKPKSNMYQSLHTKVIGPRGEPLEVQIRTWDMHRMSEFGIAAHWQYKEQMRSGDEFERKLSFLRQQLFDWQTDSKDAGEFLHSVINDLFTDQVFVFTPRGDVVDLPAGSTPVDFAYGIHSDVGNHCVGARVNGRIVPIAYRFHNGDIVEVITRSNSQPSMDWLTFVKTSHARNRIKGYYRKLHYSENVAKGREMLEREIGRVGLDAGPVLHSDDFASLVKSWNYHAEDDLFAAIGDGAFAVGTAVNRLKVVFAPHGEAVTVEGPKVPIKSKLTVTMDGVKNLMITRSKCCAPLPGENVIGYVTRGKGVALHTSTCPNIINSQHQEPERLTEINWVEVPGERFPVDLKIKVFDRVGLLNDITGLISEAHLNIVKAIIRSLPDRTADIDLTVQVPNVSDLNVLLNKIGVLQDVVRLERVSAKPTNRRKKVVA